MKWSSGWAFPASSLRSLEEMTSQLPIIGGWSLGGLQSLELALANPGEIRAMVLIAATPRFCAAEGFVHGLPEANLRAMQRSLARDPRTTIENFHKLCIAPASASADELAARVEASISLGIGTLATGLCELRERDLRGRVGKVSCPVLLLHGEADRVIPVGASQWLASRLPRATIATLPDAGHDLPVRHAEWCAARIAGFVRGLT